MRYLTINNLENGMELARTLFNSKGLVLLRQGTALSDKIIGNLKNLGYSGVYINDKFSSDIQLDNVIDDDLRMKTVDTIKQIFNIIQLHKVKEVEKAFYKISDSIDKIIESILGNPNVIINIIDLKTHDSYTFQHSVNVTVLSLITASAMYMEREKLRNLGLSAIFHDIGKIFIDKSILNKPGKLTKEEFDEMKRHSEHGFNFIKQQMRLSATIYMGILEHHEKFNKEGYPLGLGGPNINFFARIIAIADVYDALTSERPYHKAMLPSEAYEYIIANSNQHFDGNVVNAFIKKIAPYPVGTMVKLSNNSIGIVVENYTDFMTRPKLRLINDINFDEKEMYIDLKNDKNSLNTTIIEVL